MKGTLGAAISQVENLDSVYHCTSNPCQIELRSRARKTPTKLASRVDLPFPDSDCEPATNASPAPFKLGFAFLRIFRTGTFTRGPAVVLPAVGDFDAEAYSQHDWYCHRSVTKAPD